MKQFILVMIVLFGFVSHASDPERHSLVMFIGGGLAESPFMKNLCRAYEARISDQHGKVKLVRQSAVRIWNSHEYNKYTHIALVGHSLGGHAAYKLARTLVHDRNITASILLITLDPTKLGLFPNTYRDIPDPHRWLNAHLSERLRDGFKAIRWGHEPNANGNYLSHVRHNQVKRLFQEEEIDRNVMKFIGKSARPPSGRNNCDYS